MGFNSCQPVIYFEPPSMDPYDGTGDVQRFEHFLYMFQLIAQISGNEMDFDKIHLFGSYLSEAALRWYIYTR